VQHLFLVHGLLLLAPSVQVVDLLVEVVVDPLQGLDLGDEGSDPTLRLLQSLGCTVNGINLVRREVVVDPLQGLNLGDKGSDPTLRLLQSLSCTLNAINLAWWADVVDPLQGLDLGDEGTDSTLRLF
jgi:hypothetical protein